MGFFVPCFARASYVGPRSSLTSVLWCVAQVLYIYLFSLRMSCPSDQDNGYVTYLTMSLAESDCGGSVK